MKSKYIFKKAIHIPNVTKKQTKFKLYESNFEPFMRYCHIKDILTAGWITLPVTKYKQSYDSSTTQIEVEIDRRDVVSCREKQDMARFLQASWDIEVYSCDYTFPDPKRKVRDPANGHVSYPNEIFQIATTYQYYGESQPLVKHLLTLKSCAKINDSRVIVEECKNEKELIKRWVDVMSSMDPDIMYTYNGDSFDCMYLKERAVLYGLAREDGKSGYLFNKLSRLTSTPCCMKKEVFSSSAYGDSEFYRVYIPGRLNYDLLIHYKRGMKKYSSYKLDNIANEILKEGKHDVSAKDIFSFYEQGTPQKIKEIGEYCLQDTELLQKLVDKQLILTNIIQLANVTFVPIGFLTTRGQTIKVYSQVLRKARQMDFLVPHTNFNEDSYPLQLKTKDIHRIDLRNKKIKQNCLIIVSNHYCCVSC
jgi:DNA polymerase delta subunit 1